ncbi:MULTISPECIES: DotI/IcmL/TraM family protein [Cysteiniphilum]|uniref:Uncharacterized protein n=1 Tax=Cysteiniphilum litorale TaxID=2056700 RepID=A0A8J2Z392_9GAMM|nr:MULTISPECIES: DotI/IcmL/TraM family protein [Cysteiniphilum]GGF92560.1 hypothetical protein GCM10010995_07120 [Cysteiniphilum litorale]
MLAWFFKGRRKVPIHQLATEYTSNEIRKRLYLRRYILMLCLGFVILLWVNGRNQLSHQWTYYFALDDKGALASIYPLNEPQPFTRDDIIQYATDRIYQIFAVTPENYQQKHNELFNLNFAVTGFSDQVQSAIGDSGLLLRLQQGWYFAVESLGNPSVKLSSIHTSNGNVVMWKVAFDHFVLYATNGQTFSRTQSKLEIDVLKTPFMSLPSQLSIAKIMRYDLKDIGNDIGY